MIPAPPPIAIPESYSTLPTKHITVSHYPASSPVATPVIVVTLNRPKQRNAFTIQMMHDFELCYPMFDVDERVKCIVLTGAGKTFCAGADLEIGFNNAAGIDTEGPVRNKDQRDT
jgi:enoyl-CoA hydratase/carnithine racemase